MQDDHPQQSKTPRYRQLTPITLMITNITLSSFYFGYCMVYLGCIPIETIHQMYSIQMDLPTAQGLLNGCIPMGALFGALGSIQLISRFSRRQCLLVTNVCAFIIGLLILIPNFYLLFICRLIQGLCVGVYSAVVPIIIKQLAPTQISGFFGSFTQLNICMGLLIPYLLTFILIQITGDASCESFCTFIFLFPQLILLIQTGILIYVYPYQTPKYLLITDQQTACKQLIAILYRDQHISQILQQKKNDLLQVNQQINTHQVLQFELKKIDDINANLNKDSTDEETTQLQKHKKWYTLAALIALNVSVMQQLSGIKVISIYAGPMINQGLTGNLALLMPSLILFFKLLATAAGSYLLTRFGRKPILVIGGLFDGLACAMVALGYIIKDDYHFMSECLIIFGLFFFMIVFGLSLGPVVWLYVSQIVQPSFVPIPTAAIWISGSVVITLFPIITQHVLGGNPALLFAFFAVWLIIASIVNNSYMVETKDKTQSQIAIDFQAKKCFTL